MSSESLLQNTGQAALVASISLFPNNASDIALPFTRPVLTFDPVDKQTTADQQSNTSTPLLCSSTLVNRGTNKSQKLVHRSKRPMGTPVVQIYKVLSVKGIYLNYYFMSCLCFDFTIYYISQKPDIPNSYYVIMNVQFIKIMLLTIF